MTASQTLTADELDTLQQTLVDRMHNDACMPLDVAHGSLTATAASDDAVDRLFARALGKLAGDAGLSDLLARFRDQLVDDLQRAEYGPLILKMPRDDGGMLPLPYGWCQGYAAGLQFLGDERRDALMADPQAGELLAPLLALLMYDEDQYFDPPNEAAHRETVGKLGETAVGRFNWWLAREGH